jgi:hypothetical protein
MSLRPTPDAYGLPTYSAASPATRRGGSMSCCPGNGTARRHIPQSRRRAGSLTIPSSQKGIDGLRDHLAWNWIVEPERSGRWASSQAGRLDRDLGVRSIGVDSFPDQLLRRLLEIEPEVVRVQVRKLPSQHGVGKAAGRPDHDRGRALPRIAEIRRPHIAARPAWSSDQSLPRS